MKGMGRGAFFQVQLTGVKCVPKIRPVTMAGVSESRVRGGVVTIEKAAIRAG